MSEQAVLSYLNSILAELRVIRRLLEQDRGHPVMAIDKPLDPMPPASTRATVQVRRRSPQTEIAAHVLERARRVP